MPAETPIGAAEHTPECARRLPYSSPMHRSLDRSGACARCTWLWSLIDDAASRRRARVDDCKMEIVSILDSIPHGGRGPSQDRIKEQLPELLRNYYVITPAIRELLDDRVIAEHVISGVRCYVIKGK